MTLHLKLHIIPPSGFSAIKQPPGSKSYPSLRQKNSHPIFLGEGCFQGSTFTRSSILFYSLSWWTKHYGLSCKHSLVLFNFSQEFFCRNSILCITLHFHQTILASYHQTIFSVQMAKSHLHVARCELEKKSCHYFVKIWKLWHLQGSPFDVCYCICRHHWFDANKNATCRWFDANKNSIHCFCLCCFLLVSFFGPQW